MRDRVELVELQLVIGFDIDSCHPTCKEDSRTRTRKVTSRTCDTLSVVLFLVTIHAHLVASDDGLEAVLFTEPGSDVRTKLHAHTTLTWASAWLWLRIRP
ncbi:hypothetical protein PoMZ_09979 [Pyricularia oryzae]|uniref:Uncharacterized protein n=1 Tax=Pyricularia oryzae TaxID=318829 RepID=A0A4P7MWC5_PYROR|nr:hypothetical protein PoMZ_09979 [Pyricularia oryzae]